MFSRVENCFPRYDGLTRILNHMKIGGKSRDIRVVNQEKQHSEHLLKRATSRGATFSATKAGVPNDVSMHRQPDSL